MVEDTVPAVRVGCKVEPKSCRPGRETLDALPEGGPRNRVGGGSLNLCALDLGAFDMVHLYYPELTSLVTRSLKWRRRRARNPDVFRKAAKHFRLVRPNSN